MRTFLTDELPTWMASRYGVSRSADKRAIIGISFGAKDALDAAISSGGAPNAPFDRLAPPLPKPLRGVDGWCEQPGGSLLNQPAKSRQLLATLRSAYRLAAARSLRSSAAVRRGP